MIDRPPAETPFAIALFRNLWLANVASNIGAMVQSVGAAWLMTTLAGSSLMVALVQASTSFPVMLLALLAGAVADNLDRRRVILWSQIFMLVVSGLLAVAAFLGALTPAGLLIATFLIGCGTAMSWPAMQVAFSDVVPPAILPKAVALNGMGMNLARSIGPAIGGTIIVAFGAAIAFLVNALSFVPLVAVLLRWHYEPPRRAMPRERLGAAMAAGLRYAAMSPAIGTVTLRSLMFGVAASSLSALMPVIARDLVRGGPLTFGLLLCAFGIGAVGGAVGSAHIRRMLSSEQILRYACALMALGATLAGVSRTLVLTLPAMAMGGAAWLIVLSSFNIAMQLASPRWVVARSLSLYQMSTYGGVALGSWIFGWLADRFGCPLALYAAGAGLLMVAMAGLAWPMRSYGDLDLGPRDGWELPATAFPVEHRSGPIIITIEHRVAEEKAILFASLMMERSRILQRDGARRWTLQQDLSTPDLWVERYHLPTWLDYVLLNRRRTQADLANQELLAATHLPGSVPVIHRRIQRHAGAMPWSRTADHDDITPLAGGHHAG
jgi:MFS family permease